MSSDLETSIDQSLRLEAELVMTDSKTNYVPVDLGVLRSSGYVEDVEKTGETSSITFGFGGAAKAYAIAIHETPSQYDPPTWKGKTVEFHPAGRGRKYLETPLRKAVDGMDERIANRIKLK